ncbi:MAG: Peptidyl-prolyl cis-trans isomerase Mip [Gammaproteobacteria bacterium]|nr:Peptidyl-prolyl cis-trans isomerase Mip [Gammaproteobacteria bacterium]
MKSIKPLVVAALLIAPVAHAQEAGGALTTDKQRFSYAVGMQIGQSLASQGVDLDAQAFSMAVQDALSGAAPKLSPEEAEKIVKTQRVAIAKARAEKNGAAGNAFRDEYKQKEGVKAFDNGILYRVLKEGTGPKPTIADVVEVNYEGRHVNGQVFDSSQAQGGPVKFPLKGIIKGWQDTLQKMPEGSKWEIVVPPELGYGMEGGGPIGPNETLVFTIDLVKVSAGNAPAN